MDPEDARAALAVLERLKVRRRGPYGRTQRGERAALRAGRQRARRQRVRAACTNCTAALAQRTLTSPNRLPTSTTTKAARTRGGGPGCAAPRRAAGRRAPVRVAAHLVALRLC